MMNHLSRSRFPRIAGFSIMLAGSLFAASKANATPTATLQTSMGDIVVELDREHTPATVDNFVRYAKEGHFNGTVFYRVVPGFVIQAGSYDAMGKPRGVHDPIPLETANAQHHLRGTIAMGHGDDPNSARAEFFIDLADQPTFDHVPEDMDNKTGYAAFGHVVSGMEVVDAISMVPLGGGIGPFADAAPQTPVVIQKVVISN
jgi:peptidyl-prolyl cis-trans isomerase A (cyclophilin A)/peptidyl-prolyl cis-trans isomerase B (cyclophilin B)